jgi:hypothetical protein
MGINRRLAARARWTRRRGATLLAVVACALLMTACGGGDGGGSGGAAAGAAPTTAKPAGKPLPGVKEFGLTEEEFSAAVEKTQSLMASCMREAGFEYVPVDVQTIELAQKYVRSDPNISRHDYHAKWGYGETTRFDEPQATVGLGPQNLRIVNALPETDREAYERTLYGEDRHADFVWTLDEEDFSSTGGCTRKAVAAVFKPSQVDGTFVNPKDELIDSDKRIIEGQRKWSQCMRGHGYNYREDQDEIIDEYAEHLEELAGDEDPTALTGEKAAELRKLQAEEVAVSLADLDCEIKHTDAVYRTVEIEVYGQPVSG